MDFFDILTMLGGLCLFLFGMNIMGESLEEIPWRMVGELYRSYILVEQGDEAFLIDKHAAHERILFEKLRANPQDITSQTLLSPIPVRLRADAAAQLLAKSGLMESLGFELEEFGENTVLVRRVPMDLGEGQVADTLLQMADDLLSAEEVCILSGFDSRGGFACPSQRLRPSTVYSVRRRHCHSCVSTSPHKVVTEY